MSSPTLPLQEAAAVLDTLAAGGVPEHAALLAAALTLNEEKTLKRMNQITQVGRRKGLTCANARFVSLALIRRTWEYNGARRSGN
jgi:hypothetical protein